MKSQPNYWWEAFKARPLGMPIPPNFFGIAAFGLLGALVNPGLWLVGVGLEGMYLWWLSRNQRFRNTVDAQAGFVGSGDGNARYENMLAHLDSAAQAHQYDIEREAAEIVGLLQRSPATQSQVGDVRQMAWLHLKLLTARASFLEVIEVADRERKRLDDQEKRCRARLADADTDENLRRSLLQQLEVIKSRHDAHADAERRLELVDAELGRLRQQVSLVREQALLATDANVVSTSLDALSASLNEANRWLKDQHELFAGLVNDEPPPADLLTARRASVKRPNKVSE